MKLTIAAFLSFTAVVSAKLGVKTRELRAEDVGAYHTEAFETLAEKYAESKPKNELDLMMDISGILADYCPNNDSTCRSNAYKATMKQFHASQNKGDFKIPESLDNRVREKLDEAFDIIDTIDDENVKSKVESLNVIQNEIADLKDISPTDQMVGVASLSVAQESASYWTESFNDPNHPFNGLLVNIENDSTRRLQVTGNLTWDLFFPLKWSDVISADTKGAIDYSITAVESKPNLVFNFAELFLALLAGALPASAAVAFNTSAF